MAAACADAWATEYPAELYLMSGHSCDWRQREGRCSDRSVAIKCAKTCELCGPGRPMPTDLAELGSARCRRGEARNVGGRKHSLGAALRR